MPHLVNMMNLDLIELHSLQVGDDAQAPLELIILVL